MSKLEVLMKKGRLIPSQKPHFITHVVFTLRGSQMHLHFENRLGLNEKFYK